VPNLRSPLQLFDFVELAVRDLFDHLQNCFRSGFADLYELHDGRVLKADTKVIPRW
jgi:hypothetical protein